MVTHWAFVEQSCLYSLSGLGTILVTIVLVFGLVIISHIAIISWDLKLLS